MKRRAATDATRRQLRGGLGATSIAGAAAMEPAAFAASAAATATTGDYLLAPGLTYLNTASLGPTPRAVLDRTLAVWRELEANPVFQAYGDGPLATAADAARARAATLLGCTADEILITRSTTEAMNTVAQGVRLERGDRVLTTDQEHDGGRAGWHYRARRDGVELDILPIAPTDHDPAAIVDRFAAAITPRTKVISVSHVITCTGFRMPIAEIAALARRHGILCVVDGAQAVGQIAVDVKALGCHAYATAGHKWLMGPKGTGLLYVSRDGAGIEPIQWQDGRTFVAHSTGVGSQALATGLAAAIEAVLTRGVASIERHNRELHARAHAALSTVPRLQIVSPPPGPYASTMVTARLPEPIDSARVRDALRIEHRVIIKMIEKRWFNGIRLSPHVFNTEADVDMAVGAIRRLLA